MMDTYYYIFGYPIECTPRINPNVTKKFGVESSIIPNVSIWCVCGGGGVVNGEVTYM
jgi:hypothetical protein